MNNETKHKTLDLRGEDDGSVVELNKRDLLFMLRMVCATCAGNFDPKTMQEWAANTIAQIEHPL